MRDSGGSFPGNAPVDMDAVIDEVHEEYPTLAYAGPVESEGSAELGDEQFEAMGAAIFAGLVGTHF
jgi:hypothetical protein